MEEQKKNCMLCGKARALHGGICEPCQERVRREAQGEREGARAEAEKELRRHGVVPDPGREKK